jgi:large conductance mechanosensitive channel
VVIGAAFQKIVSSLVGDLLMPPLGLALGGVDFSRLSIVIKSATATAPEVAIRYGLFINALVDFLIIAAAIFAVVKLANRLTSTKESEAAPTSKDCPLCLSAIPLKAKKCAHCCSAVE